MNFVISVCFFGWCNLLYGVFLGEAIVAVGFQLPHVVFETVQQDRHVWVDCYEKKRQPRLMYASTCLNFYFFRSKRFYFCTLAHSMHTITKHKTACVFSPYLENNHSIIHTTRLFYHLIYLPTTISMVSPLTQASTLRDRYTNHPG